MLLSLRNFRKSNPNENSKLSPSSVKPSIARVLSGWCTRESMRTELPERGCAVVRTKAVRPLAWLRDAMISNDAPTNFSVAFPIVHTAK